MINYVDSVHHDGLLPNKTLILSNNEKNIRQIPIKDHYTKYLISTVQSEQVHSYPGRSEKLSQLRGTQGDMITKYNVVSWNRKNNSK